MLHYAIDTRGLNAILRLLRDLLDMRITFFDINGVELDVFDIKQMSSFCSHSRRDPAFDARCRQCDAVHIRLAQQRGEAVVYRCHAGLMEGTVPLYNQSGVYVGAIVFGQYRPNRQESHSPAKHAAAFARLPHTTMSRMRKVASLLQYLSQIIIDRALIKPENRDYMEVLRHYIDEHANQRLTLKELAAAVGKSPSYISHRFSREYGVSPAHFARTRRIEIGARLIKSGSSVREAALQCGFCDEFHFSKAFSAQFGVPPSSLKQDA